MDIKVFIEKFADAVEIEDVESLAAGTEFCQLEEWSSLSVMLLIAFYDEEFGKEITEKDIKSLATIQDLYDFANA